MNLVTAISSAVIFDSARGETIMLMPAGKVAYKTMGVFTKGVVDLYGQGAKPKDDPATIQATGGKAKIAGLAAEEYKVETADGKGTVWIAPAFPHAKEVIALQIKESEATLPATQSNRSLMATIQKQGIAGYPVKSDLELTLDDKKMRVTSVLTRVEEKSVKAEQFRVPEGYTVQDMGAMFGEGKGGSKPVPKPPKE